MKKTYKGALKASIIAGALVALTFGAQSLYADNSFEFHGYARGGMTMTWGFQNIYKSNPWGIDGGDQGVAEHYIGRLGNEGNDNYAESEFVDKSVAADGSWAKYHIMFATRYQNDFQSYPTASNMTFLVRQLYAEMGGFSWDPKSTYWVGKKYNGRDDIHILDLFWRDYSGEGFGVTNAVNGLFDASMVSTGNPSDMLVGTESAGTNIPLDWDFRIRPAAISGLSMLSGLELEYNLFYQANLKDQTVNSTIGSQSASGSDYGSTYAVVYSPDKFFWVADGYSRLVLQYATGEAGTSWNMGAAYDRNSTGARPDSSWGLRAIAFGEANNVIGQYVDVMPALIYQTYYDGFSNDDQASALTFAIRPVVKLTSNVSVQVEYGITNFMGNNNNTWWHGGTSAAAKGIVQKFTLAPTLALNSGFWGRPQLRLFYSFIGGDTAMVGDLSNNGSNQNYTNQFGCQFETWF